MSKNLLIIGAGGHGRCCLDIARETEMYGKISFLDDNAVGQVINDAKVIGKAEDLSEYVDKYSDIFVAMGNNGLRRKLIEKAEEIGFQIPSLISNKSIVSEYAEIQGGSVIFPGTVVEANARIGKGCIVAANGTVNHDAIIKDYSLINSCTVVRPNVVVGELAKVGSRCVITFGTKVETESEILDGEVI